MRHETLLDVAWALANDMEGVSPANLAAIKAAYRAAAAPVDDPALAAEARFSREWSRSSFDAAALAVDREKIQARGRQQTR